MRYIFLLLRRSRIFILFLMLEGIALYWLANSRSFQRSQMRSSTAEVQGRLMHWNAEINAYFNLRVENEYLSAENARLREMVNQSLIIQNYGRDTAGTLILNQRYSYLPAQVVNSSYQKVSNYLLLDKGQKSGARSGMGVIGPNGLVGTIHSTSAHFSRVIPVINPSFQFSAAIKGKGHFGPSRWDGRDYQYSYVYDIPRYALVSEGDSLISDGRSNIFPPGVLLGTVSEKTLQSDQNFWQLKVKLATDFSKLKQVYLVDDLLAAERDSLLQNPLP